jgi:hypothetical protein
MCIVDFQFNIFSIEYRLNCSTATILELDNTDTDVDELEAKPIQVCKNPTVRGCFT